MPQSMLRVLLKLTQMEGSWHGFGQHLARHREASVLILLLQKKYSARTQAFVAVLIVVPALPNY